MQRLPRPNLDALEVYEACAGGVSNAGQPDLYAAAKDEVLASAHLYSERAMGHRLYQFPASAWGHDGQVVLKELTKGDLRKLYLKGMVGSQKGRTYYDKLLASAPLGKCPYCRFGHVETLDHFLSKSRYPTFAVLPSNLVPACMRCNNGKGGGVFTEEAAISHPYFEDALIEEDVWLFAEIHKTSPVTVTYSVSPPGNWPADLARRVKNYFCDFELSKRYAVEAASELVSISAYLRALPESNLRVDHLKRVAEEEGSLSKSGWKAALYSALSASNWYSETGYSGSGVV